jgi:hypothetical protein
MAYAQKLIFAVFIFGACCVGCSASRQIATSADHAATLSHSVYTRAQWITTHSAEPDTIKAATGIQADALAILAETSDITVAVSGVRDIQSAYVTALIWASAAVVFAALAFILWQSGAGVALRALAGWIPRRTQNEAALARQMLSDDPTTAREFVAAKRASDPLFSAAWKRGNK